MSGGLFKQKPAPAPPANGIFKMQPGNISIGTPIERIPKDRFISAAGKEGGVRSIVYQHAYQRAGRTA